ncbi:DUF2474 family protein [Kangiella sp. TOML190]
MVKEKHNRWHKALWFVGLWLAGVLALGILGFIIRLFLASS